jgi:hypothetical protein
MKPGAFVINVGRGAALDVFEAEPLNARVNPLLPVKHLLK